MENTINYIKSYNKFLYDKRKEAGFSRRKMARQLKIPYIIYIMIENGYIKPTKRMVKKISNYYDIDYSIYLEGEASYPEELPDKPQGKASKLFFNIMGKLWLRIILIVLSLIFLVSWVYNKVENDKYSENQEIFYSEELRTFNNTLKEKGSVKFSIFNELMSPQISRFIKINENEELLFELSSSYKNTLKLNLQITYWTDDYRFLLNSDDINDNKVSYLVEFKAYNDKYVSCSDYFTYDELLKQKDGTCPYSAFINIDKTYNFAEQFDILVKEKLGYTNSFSKDIFPKYVEETTNFENYISKVSFREMMSLFIAAILIFMALYSLEYGNKNNLEKEFSHSDALLFLNEPANIKKKDMKFMPFIPEKIFQIFAIILIAIGATRLQVLGMLSSDFNQEGFNISARFLSIQMLGIFILSFIKFDLFLDDKRVLRNVSLYPLIFFIVYYIETYLLIGIKNDNSLVGNMLNIAFPNPFFSTSCYFTIMFFLFYTPQKINTKKKLIIFRLCSIIPILYIFASFFIYYSDVIFGAQISNLWIKNFFLGQRLPLSILAISYLVSIFFLRLYYKKKYGEENANRYFMGNRYLFKKNIITAIIVIIIWIFEMIFRNNTVLNKMGIGLNELLIIILPFILFYHPHKGPRNKTLDYLILFLYILVLLYGYTAAALIILLGLV